MVNIDWTSLLIHGGMAFMGGIAKATKKKKSRILEYVACGVVASFSGVLLAVVLKHFLPTAEYLHLAGAGVGGWLGADGIEIIVKIIKKVIADTAEIIK